MSPRMSLGCLGQIFDGPHATPTRQREGPYFLNIASLRDGRLDLEESDRISRTDFERWTRRVTPQPGDLLFSYETRIGEAALMPQGIEACLGRRMALLRPQRDRVHPRFLLYFYLSPDFQATIARNTIHGATVNRIGIATMGQWEITLPHLEEQRAIAEVLGALDDKIAANHRTVRIASSLCLALAATGPRRTPLSSLATLARVMLHPASLGDGVVSLFSLPAFDSGARPEVATATAIKSGKFVVEGPSVLLSKLNPRIPRVWDVPRLPGGVSLASTEFLVLRPLTGSSTALWAALGQLEFLSTLQAQVAGTSGSHQRVRPDAVMSAPVADPNSVSADARETLTSLGEQMWQLRQESQKLREARDELLPLLMSGRLRVKDAEKAVEEVV